MAISEVSFPADGLYSMFNPLTYEVSSNDPDIKKMKCVVYIDGTAINDGSPIVLDPDLGGSPNFTFDLHKLISRSGVITHTKPTLGAAVSAVIDASSNSLGKIRAVFTEVILSGGLLTDAGSLDTDTAGDNIYVINGGIPHVDHVSSWVLPNYDIKLDGSADYTYKLLTNAPSRSVGAALKWDSMRKVGLNQDMFLDAYSTYSGGEEIEVRLVTYNAAGIVIDVDEVALTNAKSYDRFIIPCGPRNINATTWQLATTFDFTNVAYYVIAVERDSDTLATELHYFHIDRSFDANKHRTFAFLNRLGGIDLVNFKGEEFIEQNVKRNIYEKRIEQDYTLDDYGFQTIRNKTETVHTTYTTALNYAEKLWMQELYTSPNVWLVENDNLIPIRTKGEKFRIHQGSQGDMDLRLQWQLSLEQTIQGN